MRTWIARSRFLSFLLVLRNEKWYIRFCHSPRCKGYRRRRSSGMIGDSPQSPDSTQLYGGEAMTFDEVLEQALEMLQRRGRVSYRALKVQFQLDDDLLEILAEDRPAGRRVLF